MTRPPSSFSCPGCGGEMDAVAGTCACGARLVGEPLLEPPSPKPTMGSALASVAFAGLSALSVWFRPSLAFAAVAVVTAIRALRAARTNPARFGGAKTASAGLVLGCVMLAGVGGWWASGIPRAVERAREQRAAATRAEMYRVSERMVAYRARFGAYPTRISDLGRLEDGVPAIPSRDAWDQRISYAAFTSGVASRGRAPALNANFELRSPGADGVPNTPDDIVMRDGQIIDGAAEGVPPAGRLPVTVPVGNRFR